MSRQISKSDRIIQRVQGKARELRITYLSTLEALKPRLVESESASNSFFSSMARVDADVSLFSTAVDDSKRQLEPLERRGCAIRGMC